MSDGTAIVSKPESPNRVKRLWRAIRSVPANAPLRLQLIFVVLLLVAVGLIISNFAGSKALRGYLLDRVDAQLVSTARDTFRSGNIRLDGDQPYMTRSVQGPMLSDAFYTEISNSDGEGSGQLRVPSDSNQTAPRLPSLTLPLSDSLDGKPITASATGAGSSWRLLTMSLPGNAGALTVGTTLEDVNETVSRLQFINIIVSVVVLILLGLVGSLVVHASLRRLSQVEATANAIANGDMSRRVPEWSTDTEVGRLAHSFNTMLERIENAFAAQQLSESQARESEERMRRFVADASHELRTPLTSIRGFAELRRQGVTSSPELVDTSFLRIESEAQRMTLLVEDLLLLARLDQQRPLAREQVDLVKVAKEVVQSAAITAADHEFRVEVDIEDLSLVGDEARLHQVVSNLVNNAVMHTPPGTAVTVRVSQETGQAVIEVADSGPGMTQEETERVFERFYRADPARTRAQGGSGLGLSIVAGIVEAHGGTVAARSESGHGATFIVRIPLATNNWSTPLQLGPA